MNIVQFDSCAFILPDDMDSFRKRYSVDVLFLDEEDGSIMGFGPSDKEWRAIPEDTESGLTVVPFKRSKE